MIKAHYNPITGQSFKIVDDNVKTKTIKTAQLTFEKVQKQKLANIRKTNCRRK